MSTNLLGILSNFFAQRSFFRKKTLQSSFFRLEECQNVAKDDIKKRVLVPVKSGSIHLDHNSELNVSGILIVNFFKSNTTLSLLDSFGNLLFSHSAGLVGLEGKEKSNRLTAIKKMLVALKGELRDMLIDDIKTLSLQVKNAGSKKGAIIRVVKTFFPLQSLKVYDRVPYNGCRKKKNRRKKFSKVIKR